MGQYSTEILTNLGILDSLEAAGKITYGSNVKEVTTQVSEAAADAGIIYATDAFSAKLTVVDQAGSDLCKQVIYPAAVLNVSKNQEAAKEFLAYLQTDTCMKVFEAVGFAAAE
ncbi:MAG: molybdate ABC transporter substrate-binding protein [Eubacteriales bacterium]